MYNSSAHQDTVEHKIGITYKNKNEQTMFFICGFFRFAFLFECVCFKTLSIPETWWALDCFIYFGLLFYEYL